MLDCLPLPVGVARHLYEGQEYHVVGAAGWWERSPHPSFPSPNSGRGEAHLAWLGVLPCRLRRSQHWEKGVGSVRDEGCYGVVKTGTVAWMSAHPSTELF